MIRFKYALIDKRNPHRVGYLEFIMNRNWQSSKNYINEKLLNSEESITLTKSVEINYKSVSIPPAEQDHIKIQALSFL